MLLPYSSGTSGLPKGVMLTHRQLVSSLCQSIVPHHVRADNVVIGVLPMFHIFGMQVSMNLTLRAGATLVTIPRFSLDSFLGVVEAYRVTRAELVPPIVLALAKRPEVDRYDLSSLRVIASGAAPLGLDLARACAERLGCRVKQGYGMTELGGASHLAPDTGRDDPESIGPAIPGVQCRVVNTVTGADTAPGERGELLVRTPATMLGYLNNPQATAATIDPDRWVHTGDIATVDEQGWFRVVDRLKELIKYKGYQVAPAELEGILLTNPSVADCAVIGSPDLEAGEVPKAFVVLRPGCTSDGLLDWGRSAGGALPEDPAPGSRGPDPQVRVRQDPPPDPARGRTGRPEPGPGRSMVMTAMLTAELPPPGRPQAGRPGGAGDRREPGTGPADRRDPRRRRRRGRARGPLRRSARTHHGPADRRRRHCGRRDGRRDRSRCDDSSRPAGVRPAGTHRRAGQQRWCHRPDRGAVGG